jgi:serine/threonine-protein kinase
VFRRDGRRDFASNFLAARANATATLPELVPDPDGALPQPRDLFQPGELIEGKYEIRGVLGAGGMGQVYEARDRGLNRLVALKAAWPTIGPEPLRREAQVLAAFRHPGLPVVHALGSHEGVEFMVMERLSGTTLAAHLGWRKEPLAVEECLDLLLAMCEALAPLHASGLAHADLKPANIMLVPGDRMVLLDFGIARIEQLRAGAQRITGSPHYMAPEAIRGAVQVGEAHLVDLYAIGVIAFVMLTGTAPFDHPSPVELMLLHLHQPAPRVSARRAEVPLALDRLIADLLAKQPMDRPADLDVLRAELRRLRRHGQ